MPTAVQTKGPQLSDDVRLDPARTALVLIDIQNDFCDPQGVFGKLGNDVSMMPRMAERSRLLVNAARRRGILTLFVRATYDGEVLAAPLAETYHLRGFLDGLCAEGSWGAEWYGGLAPDPDRPNEITLTKHRFSAFWDTEIDLILRSNRIRTVVFAGVVTSGCVESTLRDAFFRDYHVVVVRDAVAEASYERHEASLRKIDQAFGVVRDAAEIAVVWERSNRQGVDISFEGKLSRALATLSDRVDPRHTALVLVDLQRDFCHPDGVMARLGEDLSAIANAVTQAARLLHAARVANMPVIHIRAEYGAADSSDVSLFASSAASGTSCCRPDTDGCDFMPEVAPRPGEWIVVKHRFSAFVDTRLGLLLRSNGIRTIIVCGVATQCCVESTVRDAALRDYYVVVGKEATAARGRMQHLHEASLEVMNLFFADCRPVDEIIAAMPFVKLA
jgi:nicotinamidase-related amidase